MPKEEHNNETQNEETVSKRAYDEVRTDMHKFKGLYKEMELKLQKMKEKQDEQARQDLEKNNEYKTLYEDERAKNAELYKQIDEKNENFIKTQKVMAVNEKLGEFKRPEYKKFIDLSKIVIDNDGNADITTVDAEVERLRKEYPELIKVKASSRMPDHEPESGGPINTPLEKMTAEQRNDLRRKIIEKARSN